MTVLDVKPTIISLLNITLLLLYHFIKMLLISIIVSQWIQKIQSLPLQIINHKYIRPVKKQTKTLLQQNPLLNETNLDSDYDPIFKRIPNAPKPQFFEFNEPIVSNPLDPHLQKELVYKTSVAKHHSLAITPTPIKSTSKHNVIPYFDPSIFEHTKEN